MTDSTNEPDATETTADRGTGSPEHDPLRERVEAALRSVRDPDLDVTLFEAGLIEAIHVDGGEVVVEATIGEFPPQDRQGVTRATVRAVRAVDGVDRVHVESVTESAAADDDGRTTGAAAFDTVVAVASAKGGVGKSTVATRLACALAAERDVCLFDADIHGPNVPTLLDREGPIHADDDGNPLAIGVDGLETSLELMSVGLMEEGAPLAWRGAMAHDAVTDLFENTAWRTSDTLVIDLPPGTGDVVLTTLQEVPVDGVVLVTTPFPASVDDTRRSAELFRENAIPILGTVVNMGGFTCPSCGEAHDLFEGSPAADLTTPIVARLPFDPALQEQPVPGDTPETVRPLVDRVRERLDAVRGVDADDAVDIRDDPPERRRKRVREAFTALDAGEEFRLVSDRDPTPVRKFLVSLADGAGEPASGNGDTAFDDLTVERRGPETWLLTTTRP
jgi:ATP-binding protein involved in chromosome partitioning